MTPATEKQQSFITRLTQERRFMGTPAEAAVSRFLDERSKQNASAAIDALLQAPKIVTAPAAPQPPAEIPNGTYTIVFEPGDWLTLQVRPATWADEPGLREVAYLCGPDNELSYKGFAFLKTDGRIIVWKRYRDESRLTRGIRVLTVPESRHGAHEKFLEEAEAYAIASGSCYRCGRTLTVPASLHRGLGPICAEIEGVA